MRAGRADHIDKRMFYGYCADLLLGGGPLDRDSATYLGEVLEAIYNGEDPAKALGLTKQAKRPSERRRDLEITIDYKRHRKRGDKAIAARHRISDEWGQERGLSEDRIKKIVRKHKLNAYVISEFFRRERLEAEAETSAEARDMLDLIAWERRQVGWGYKVR
jgi:hypothetical protein